MQIQNDRRRFIFRVAGGVGALFMAGCERLSRTDWFPKILSVGEPLNSGAQHLVASRKSMAQEFTEDDLSPSFRINGTSSPCEAARVTITGASNVAVTM